MNTPSGVSTPPKVDRHNHHRQAAQERREEARGCLLISDKTAAKLLDISRFALALCWQQAVACPGEAGRPYSVALRRVGCGSRAPECWTRWRGLSHDWRKEPRRKRRGSDCHQCRAGW